VSKDDSYLVRRQSLYLDRDDILEKKEVEEEIAELIEYEIN